MKRYLFLKLGLSILVFAAASPRSQENVGSNRDENRRNNAKQNGPQSASNEQRGDTQTNGRDYQGVMGKPGVDFPVLTYIPRTKFNCRGKKSGYYADLETNCQVFHICDEGRKVSFLCPNGTIFQQIDLICDWWFKVDCASSPNLYDESAEQLYEDNLKRKENRRVQQQERRTNKVKNQDNNQNIHQKSNSNNQNIHNTNYNQNRNNENANHNTNGNLNTNANHNAKNNGIANNPNSKNTNQNNNYKNNNNNNGNSNQNENRQEREFVKQRKVINTQRNIHTNYANKKVNHYQENRYNNEQRIEYDAKETQEPSETASFVNNRYNAEAQKNYYKSFNDIGEKTATNVPPKSYITGEFDPIKIATERSINRGGRNFNSGTSSNSGSNNSGYNSNNSGYTYNKVNKVSDFLKTTTQHTIYSPTVPPFTSRYPTRTTAPITLTQPRTKSKQMGGFYITKDVTSTNTPSYDFTRTTAETSPAPIYTTAYSPTVQPKNSFPINIDMLHTTPAAVNPTYRPLVASGIIAGSDEFIDESQEVEESAGLLNSRLALTNSEDTSTPSIQTTTQESARNPKKLTFSTLAPEENRIRNVPSIPTPFRTQTEAIPQTTFADIPTTNHFQQYTYLPHDKTYLPKSNDKVATPRPTIPTEYTTYSTMSSVTDNLSNMIKTLQELEPDNPSIEKYLGTRPGLNIPPSAGPKTLHSLAIYFATALDNLVAANETDLEWVDEKSTTDSDGGAKVTLLSRTTQDSYNLLFNENNVEADNATHHETHEHSPLDLRYLVEHDANDLDVQQSRGLVSSSTPRIRQLAQVFTQALSAYLDDPDTFKKVLEEIRPTEPPIYVEDITEPAISTTVSTTSKTSTEYRSYTKEEDEVLDFSDVDKSSTYRPYNENSISTTQSSTKTVTPTESTTDYLTTERPTPNYLALDLNNRLKLSTTSPLQNIEEDDESSTENNTESQDYFPFNTGKDDEEAKRKATASPYGFGVKPENSTPISIDQIPPTAGKWADLGFNNTEYKPSDSLLPPLKISLLNTLDETNSSYTVNEESLQSAHSQSFLSHTSNSLHTERTGKSFKGDITTTEFPDTTSYTTQSPNEYTTTNSPRSTPDFETTTLFNHRPYYDETTTNRNVETTTDFNRNRQYDDTTTDKNRFGETTTRQYDTITDVNNRYYGETTTNFGETTTNYRSRQYYDETTTDKNRQYYEETTTDKNRLYDTTTNRQNSDETTTQFYRNHQNTEKYDTTTNRQYYSTNRQIDETTTQYYKNHQNADETTIYNRNNQYFDEVTTYKRNRQYETTTDGIISTTTDYPRTESTTYNPTTTEFTTEQATTTKPVPDNHWSTSPEVTKLWESTLYTDPLLINQNLQNRFGKDLDLETITPTTYSPEYSAQRTTTEYIDESIIDLKFSTTEAPVEHSTIYTTIDLGIHNLLNSTELEIASSQANQIFGNLDSTEQDLLIEKMKEAESNSTVRRLILLLVSTCDASLSNNKTVQETRNSILNALLNVPIENKFSNRSGRKLYETTTEYISTTALPDTTSQPESTGTSSVVSSIDVSDKSLHVKDVHQDTRALELLRSLYSLAAKWGKK